MIGSGTRIGHNIRGFDNQILKMAGVSGVGDIDTLSMAKSLLKIGDKSAATGKALTSYSLSSLAKWLGVDTGSISGAAHTGSYDVELNERVYKALSKMAPQKSAATSYTITDSQAAKAVKSYYRRGPMDYKIDSKGKPIYDTEHDFYSANRFMRKGANYQYGGSQFSGVEGYDYHKYIDMETGEQIMMMMSDQEHQAFIDQTFGGGKRFKNAVDLKPKDAASVWRDLTSSAYGYQGLMSMFKKDNSGKYMKDSAGDLIWKDEADNMTEFRRSQLELLKTKSKGQGSGAKAM
jgi:hypothetical protein